MVDWAERNLSEGRCRRWSAAPLAVLNLETADSGMEQICHNEKMLLSMLWNSNVDVTVWLQKWKHMNRRTNQLINFENWKPIKKMHLELVK